MRIKQHGISAMTMMDYLIMGYLPLTYVIMNGAKGFKCPIGIKT